MCVCQPNIWSWLMLGYKKASTRAAKPQLLGININGLRISDYWSETKSFSNILTFDEKIYWFHVKVDILKFVILPCYLQMLPKHNPIFKHERHSTFLTDVKYFALLINNVLTCSWCGSRIRRGSCGILWHIRRNLCHQDEPGPENKTGQSIIRQN